MHFHHQLITMLVIILGMPAGAFACAWDYDTLRQERARFPSALELVTGKFLRHSKEFYEWRIQDRLNKLKSDPNNLGYHDDLAVAYEKTGQHARAIETILAKEKIKPGLYETYANLGTFHILAGDFELGLPYIDKALEINPEAHFGRERYQKWLVEYAITRRQDGQLRFPLRMSYDSAKAKGVDTNYFDFVKQRLGKKDLTEADTQKAVQGVLGMMRFANYDNPLLLEALADLLLHPRSPSIDAKRLAARCYLKVSYEIKDQAAQQAYRKLAEHALTMQTRNSFGPSQLTLSELEADFRAELADANQWYAELKEKEIGWIRDGKDADVEFDRLYSEEPTALGDPTDGSAWSTFTWIVVLGAGMGLILLVLVLVVLVATGIPRRGKRAAGGTQRNQHHPDKGEREHDGLPYPATQSPQQMGITNQPMG